jgi:ATP-binding cassette subfamily B protein
MTVGFIIKFIGTIMDLFIPWILSHMIDDVAPTGSVRAILLWGVLMVVCSVAALLGNIIANRMAALVSANITRNLRHNLFQKIAYLSCHNVDEFTVPSIISRLTSDTYNVHQMIGMIQRLGIRAPILLIGGIAVTVFLDFGMSMTLVAVLPFVTVAVFTITKKGIPLFTNLQKAVDMLVRTVRENITGVRVIKALSKGEYEKQRFNTVNENVVAPKRKPPSTWRRPTRS